MRPPLRLLLALLLAGCSSMPAYVKPALDPARVGGLQRVVLMPPRLQMMEVSAGGVPEPVRAWAEEARVGVEAAVRRELSRRTAAELVDPPVLEAPQQLALERHGAFFRRVAQQLAAVRDMRDTAWTSRRGELDYSIGPGLAGVAEACGCDAALFVDGVDYVSTPGRRVLLVLSTLMFGLPVIPPGAAYLQAGLVDLRSGDVLWLGRDYSMTLGDLREATAVDKLLANIFAEFPGSTPAAVARR